MLGHREMSIDDYLAMARRRKWLLAIPAAIFPVIAFTVSLFITDVYTSRTLVLVEQQKVPDSIVQSVVAEDIAQQLMKRGSFRRTIKRALEQVMEAGAHGVEIDSDTVGSRVELFERR